MLQQQQCCDESLLCTEVLDLSKTPERTVAAVPSRMLYPELPPTVSAGPDCNQMRDRRVLQNLLRSEHRYLPPAADYMSTVQAGALTPAMRKIVADWMLEVVHEQNSQPEVFCLAVNIMDRFLCHCRIAKSQLQLLGSVCILISSKIHEPCPIPGKVLITYTDYSITAEELKEWELLVLYKLQWELTAITPMDFLDHSLPRLGLDRLLGLDAGGLTELRRRTETILVLAATEYQFAYRSPSLMAAASIVTALHSLSSDVHVFIKDVRLSMQTVMHTPMTHMDDLTHALNAILPDYLKWAEPCPAPSPDSSSDRKSASEADIVILHHDDDDQDCLFYVDSTEGLKIVPAAASPGGNDLCCSEELSNASSSDLKSSSSDSRSSTPLSAIDVFTEFNTGVLAAVFEQADKMDSMDSMDSVRQDSILVSLCNPSQSTQGHYNQHGPTPCTIVL